jgi:hypothetical protein
MASSPESATSSLPPPGVTPTLTGCVPMPCGRSTDSVRSTFMSSVSITATRSWLATAT